MSWTSKAIQLYKKFDEIWSIQTSDSKFGFNVLTGSFQEAVLSTSTAAFTMTGEEREKAEPFLQALKAGPLADKEVHLLKLDPETRKPEVVVVEKRAEGELG